MILQICFRIIFIMSTEPLALGLMVLTMMVIRKIVVVIHGKKWMV